MFVTRIIAVETDEQIRETADLASQIWRQHFIPIIGKDRWNTCLQNFSPILLSKHRSSKTAMNISQCLANGVLAGYCRHSRKGPRPVLK